MHNLIRTKIHLPPVPENLIARPHLIEHLCSVPNPKLILVSAPAGFGKSTAVNVWAQQQETPAAWYALDSSDNDPVRFWTYLLAAIQHAGVSLSPGITQMASPGGEALVIALINELVEHAAPLTVILDDYHLISERNIHDALRLLLDHLPESVTLVVITRADPSLVLGRLRARGQMIELRAAELRFMPDEVAAFFHDAMGLALETSEITALDRRAEGWPAGLQLAALAIRGHADPAAFAASFAGSHHYIVEYLTEEVISQQPDEIQRFLLETAHLDRLCVPLCNAVTGHANSDRLLAHLQEQNLFLVALDTTHTWYRYHHLFAELLRHRQHQTLGTEEKHTLYQRASRWHEEHERISDAVEYALAGQLHQDGVRLLEDNWHHILHQGEISTLRRWLGALPASHTESSAPLSMAYCWLHHLAGEPDAVGTHLKTVQHAWAMHDADGTIPDREAWIVIPALAKTMQAIIALQQGNAHAALDYAREALTLIPDDARVNRELLAGSATYRMAQAQRELGQYDDAIAIMLDGLEQLKRTNNVIGVVRGTYDVVHMYLAVDQPHKAQKLCESTLQHLAHQGCAHLPLTGLVHAALAEIAITTGAIQAAHDHLADAQTIAGNSRNPLVVERLEALHTQLTTMDHEGSGLIDPLTDREMDVLHLLSEGYSNQQIAEQLVITEDTVKRHNTHIYGKLAVSNRTQAVLRAQELGLL